MPDRCDEMTDVPDVSQQRADWHQLGQVGMSDGATTSGQTPRQQSSLTGMKDDAKDHVQIPNPTKLNKINCRVDSFEEKLCNMPGSIRTFDGPADAEFETSDDTTVSPPSIGSDGAECAISTTKQTVGYGKYVVGRDKSMVTCLEPLLIGLIARLLEMSSCIIQTLGKVLHMSYVYSETGDMKMEGTLVLDVLRSIIYTLILGAIAAALARVVQLAVKMGMGIAWVVKGLFWVLI
jgi:hypothetical protein